MTRANRSILPCLLVLLVGACYSFQPADPATPPPTGSMVRAVLRPGTPSDEFVLAERSRSDEAEDEKRYRGELLRWDPDTLAMAVVTPGAGSPLDTVQIPARYVSRVETMHFQGTRTGALVGAGALLLAVYVAHQFDAAESAPPSGDPVPDPGGFRVPLFRFGLPD